MKELTLALLIKGSKLLLAMKKREFGAGKWNGYGGKKQEDESIEDAAIREIREEGEVTVAREDLVSHGYIDFYFSDKPELDQRVYLFRTDKWAGEPVETEEMRPEWFAFDAIPYHEMWVGDDQWIPLVIAGRKISGNVHFAEGGKKLLKVELQ